MNVIIVFDQFLGKSGDQLESVDRLFSDRLVSIENHVGTQ